MKIIIIPLLMLSTVSYADCWKVGELKGYSARNSDGYILSADGLTGQEYSLNIDGDGTAVIPNDMQCMELTAHSILCVGEGTVEVWSVDPLKNAAYYTKSANGFGAFDGPTIFVGKIIGSCN
jgi:hypothetical protein